MDEQAIAIAKLDRNSINVPDKLDVPYTLQETLNGILLSVAVMTFVSCIPMLSGREIPVVYRIVLGGLFSAYFVIAILWKSRKHQSVVDAQRIEYADFIGTVRTLMSTHANHNLSDKEISQLNEGKTVSFGNGFGYWMTKDKDFASIFKGPQNHVAPAA